MADVFRQPTYVPIWRKPYLQVDPVPNIAPILSAIPPFIQRLSFDDWYPPRKWAQDFNWAGYTTRNIPPPPVSVVQAPLPELPLILRRVVLTHETGHNEILPGLNTLVPKPPFAPYFFPDVFRTAGRDFQFQEGLSYLPGPVIAPYIPVDFPTPMRARATPQDFSFTASSIPPPAPFSQTEWPLFVPPRRPHLDLYFSGYTTRNIPTGVQLPPSFTDWPLPLRARNQYSESWSSPELVLTTVIARPFSQSEFPTPLRARAMPQDFQLSGATTRGISPAAISLAAVKLDAAEPAFGSIFLSWSASPGAGGYRLYISGVPQPPVLTSRILRIDGLIIAQPYTFAVVATNAAGIDSSPLSNVILYEHGASEEMMVEGPAMNPQGLLGNAAVFYYNTLTGLIQPVPNKGLN